MLHHQWPSRALSWMYGRWTRCTTCPSVHQMTDFPWQDAKSNWDPGEISQARAALITSGRRVSPPPHVHPEWSNLRAQDQPIPRGRCPFSPMEAIFRTAEGRKETELSWSLPEIEPATRTTQGPCTLAKVEANIFLECKGTCPLAYPRHRVWIQKGKLLPTHPPKKKYQERGWENLPEKKKECVVEAVENRREKMKSLDQSRGPTSWS